MERIHSHMICEGWIDTDLKRIPSKKSPKTNKLSNLFFLFKPILPPLISTRSSWYWKTYGVEQYIKTSSTTIPIHKNGLLEDCRFTNIESKIDYNNPPPVVWEIIQAHPSFSYEDFVRGMTTKSGTGLHLKPKIDLGQNGRIGDETFTKYKTRLPKSFF